MASHPSSFLDAMVFDLKKHEARFKKEPMRHVIKQVRTPIEIPARVLNTNSTTLAAISVMPDGRYQKPEISPNRPALGDLVIRSVVSRGYDYGRKPNTVDRVEHFRSEIIALMDMTVGYGRIPETLFGHSGMGTAQAALVDRVFQLSGSNNQGEFAANMLGFIDKMQSLMTAGAYLNFAINGDEMLELFVENGPDVLVQLHLASGGSPF